MHKFNSVTKFPGWLMALLAVALMVGCGGGSDATNPMSSAKSITSFSVGGVVGVIDQTAKTVALTVPNATSLTAMVATFTLTGGSATVGTVAQVSAATPNDFSSPVTYTVTAADGSTSSYVVTVTVASANAKAITAFSFAGYSAYPGVIAEPAHTIAVTLPSGTVITALTAAFTSTGTGAVTIGGVTQVSGAAPTNDFTTSKSYLVTAADSTTATYVVTVTLSVAAANPTAPVLGEAGRFVILASQGITGGAGSALVNGDIAVMDQARTFMTGFTPTNAPADGLYNELTGQTWAVELSISYASGDANPAPFPAPLAFAAPHTAYATTLALINQSRTDLGVAYVFLATDPNPGMATQVCPTQLGSLTLTPGVYKTASNVLITTGTLNLDAQGNANAVWIFSIDGTLTTGAPGGNIVFVGGVGSARNVFWRVAGVTTIGTNTAFRGNVFGYANVDVLANANITGSLYSTTASVTLITDAVTKAP